MIRFGGGDESKITRRKNNYQLRGVSVFRNHPADELLQEAGHAAARGDTYSDVLPIGESDR